MAASKDVEHLLLKLFVLLRVLAVLLPVLLLLLAELLGQVSLLLQHLLYHVQLLELFAVYDGTVTQVALGVGKVLLLLLQHVEYLVEHDVLRARERRHQALVRAVELVVHVFELTLVCARRQRLAQPAEPFRRLLIPLLDHRLCLGNDISAVKKWRPQQMDIVRELLGYFHISNFAAQQFTQLDFDVRKQLPYHGRQLGA
mmetsp:Transcript_25472/g.61928  ORF Transcript_25472/g.61928 Transcript_25472/m.61928 type:complete len:200 (-) Transcript_25472:1263-1862(-)